MKSKRIPKRNWIKKIVSNREVIDNPESHISMIQLIANPEKYNRKRIQIVGFLRIEFECHGIYLHKEDFDNRISHNGFWVTFSDKILKNKNLENYKNKYVIIIGTFEILDKDLTGTFTGTIKNITRLEPLDLS